ncbi:MAG: hypothetical protein COT85_01120 [Chlamydiae bacterium CG10_big_fil_rev_8_21_14_0_10_42_34]|nr:MAG: hypothetical protein COT85_01120 [Chlamydiae bacterium CG10_big_fil_rev_8_21_14_0_10_42_34]
MDIAHNNYSPFQHTQMTLALFSKIGTLPHNTFWESIKKVSAIALVIISTTITFAAELIHFSATSIYKIVSYFKNKPTDKSTLLQCPCRSYELKQMNNTTFFKSSIDTALSFLDPETRKAYKELLRNEGELDSGDTSVNIFQWSSSCLLIHHLRIGPNEKFYPHKSNDLKTKLAELKRSFAELKDHEKVEAFMQIITSGERTQNTKCKLFINNLYELANEINRDQYFNTQILSPVLKQF